MNIRIAVVALGLALAALASPAAGQEVAPTPAPLIARFLDVGQGDGAWLTTPDGRTVLIDCGPGGFGRKLVVDLKAAGVQKIDVLALSHAHADHVGGCIEVIRQLPVDEVLWTGQTDTSQTWNTLFNEIQTRGLHVTTIEAGQVFDWGGGAKATVYNPMSHADGSSINEYDDSHVLLVEYAGTRLLFVGDLHSRGEQRALAAGLPPVDILKVAEHGSASGSSPEFLAAIHPRLAILSYATPNSFGLPSPTVMARLAQDGIQPLTTDEHGTITISVNGYTVAMDH
jgi:beta-lactamase superfamily II metal-dependent hydrolase